MVCNFQKQHNDHDSHNMVSSSSCLSLFRDCCKVGLDAWLLVDGWSTRAQLDWAETGNKPEEVGSNSLSSIRERRLSSSCLASSS